MNLRDQLQAIYDQRGALTPRILMDEARAETHPLHSRIFDRAEGEAAEAWYLHRAHELIRSARVVYRKGEAETEGGVRAFHAVRSADEDGGWVYKPVDEVTADPVLTELVRRDMEREWKTLLRRFRQFDEFVAMVQADLGDEAAA